MEVSVQYKWKPNIYIACQFFGHTMDSCSLGSATQPPSPKLPLPRPVLKWVPKVKNMSSSIHPSDSNAVATSAIGIHPPVEEVI